MKKHFLLLTAIPVLLLQSILSAQDFDRIDILRHTKETINFLNDANGKPFKSLRNFEEEGSPFFAPDYIDCDIQMVNGKTYHNIPIKINLLTGEIIFKTSDDQEMLVVNPFQRITFKYEGKHFVFRSGFPSIDKLNDLSVYQLLDSGTTILLKHTSVSYQDKSSYNSTAITRSYNKNETMYAWVPDKGMVRLPKKEEDWNAFFGAQLPEMKRFMRDKNSRLKKEEDVIELFRYYNQLLKQVVANKN